MTWFDVKILLKVSVFFILGSFITSGLGMVFALIILPELDSNVEFLTEYFVIQRGFSLTLYFLFMVVGLLTIAGSIYFVGFSIASFLIDKIIGWNDVKQKFPKLFGGD